MTAQPLRHQVTSHQLRNYFRNRGVLPLALCVISLFSLSLSTELAEAQSEIRGGTAPELPSPAPDGASVGETEGPSVETPSSGLPVEVGENPAAVSGPTETSGVPESTPGVEAEPRTEVVDMERAAPSDTASILDHLGRGINAPELADNSEHTAVTESSVQTPVSAGSGRGVRNSVEWFRGPWPHLKLEEHLSRRLEQRPQPRRMGPRPQPRLGDYRRQAAEKLVRTKLTEYRDQRESLRTPRDKRYVAFLESTIEQMYRLFNLGCSIDRGTHADRFDFYRFVYRAALFSGDSKTGRAALDSLERFNEFGTDFKQLHDYHLEELQRID